MQKIKVYEKKAKTRKRKHSFFPTLTLILVIAGFSFSSYYAYDYAIMRQEKYTEDYQVIIDEANLVEVKIPYGATTKSIAVMLKDLNIIDSVFLFQALSNINGYDGQYTSGTHMLNYGMGYEDIMIILSSEPEILKVTIPEGFTIEQIKERMAILGLIDEYEFDQAEDKIDISDFDTIKIKGFRDHRLEGYLFPDTYEFDKNAGEEYIISRLMRRFKELFDDEMIIRAEKMNMSIDDIVILASILEKESSTYDERRKIAGVFYNKLNSDDANLKKLQSTATLQYIFVRDEGVIHETLTLEDELVNDLYNTFIFEGLPEGPICNPGLESLMAALYPEEHEYYYFTTKGDGTDTHLFYETYEEYQEALGN